jgi:TonB family protein
MRGSAFVPAIAFLFPALAGPATAAAPPAARQVWQVDWEQAHCTISTGDPASLFFAVWLTPGDTAGTVYLVAPAERLKSGKKVRLTLAPGGDTFEAEPYARPGKAGASVVQLTGLRERFLPAFAKASAIRLQGFKEPISIPVTGAGQATAALRKCVDQKLPEWGIDPKAFNALRAPPLEPGNREWIGFEDYPSKALDAMQSGDVVARLNVDAAGRVTDCAVVVSSGSKPIDAATCAAARKRARFTPAISANGRPTAAFRTVRVMFRISEGPTTTTLIP